MVQGWSAQSELNSQIVPHCEHIILKAVTPAAPGIDKLPMQVLSLTDLATRMIDIGKVRETPADVTVISWDAAEGVGQIHTQPRVSHSINNGFNASSNKALHNCCGLSSAPAYNLSESGPALFFAPIHTRARA